MEEALTEYHKMDAEYLDGLAISSKRSILSTVTEGTLRYTKGAQKKPGFQIYLSPEKSSKYLL